LDWQVQTYTTCPAGEPQGGRSGADPDGVLGIAKLAELLFKGFQVGSADEGGVLHYLLNDWDDLIAQLSVLTFQIDEGYVHLMSFLWGHYYEN